MHEIKQNDNVEQITEFSVPKFEKDSNLNIDQAELFWNAEFDDIPEYEYDDDMFAEIFNCSEDDFIFDIKLNDDLQEIIDRILGGKWNELSEEEKADMLQELSDSISELLCIEESPLVAYYEGDLGDCGFYSYMDNTVNLNTIYFNTPEKLIEIVSHEIRHAYQHQRAEICENYVDMLYKCNFDNYILPVPLPDGTYLFFTDYQDQFVETEARAYSKAFMEAINYGYN